MFLNYNESCQIHSVHGPPTVCWLTQVHKHKHILAQRDGVNKRSPAVFCSTGQKNTHLLFPAHDEHMQTVSVLLAHISREKTPCRGCWEGLQVCAIRLQAKSSRDAGISQRVSSFTRWLRLLSVSSLKPIQERRVWTCASLAPDPPLFHLHLFVWLWSAFLSGLKTSRLR